MKRLYPSTTVVTASALSLVLTACGRIGSINHLFVGSQRAVSPDWPRHLPSASHVGRPNGM
jgi:hypothetical protein